MTHDHRPARHGGLYWTGMALLALWNIGMLALAAISNHAYNACLADDGIICFDLTTPILLVMFAMDGLIGLVAALVHRHRARRAR